MPLEKKITPTAIRYPDNNGCQYVRVDFGYNTNPDTIEGEIVEKEESYYQAIGNKDFNINFEGAQCIVKDFKLLQQQITNDIIAQDRLLNKKQELCDFLQRVILKFDTLVNGYSNILSSTGINYLRYLYGNSSAHPSVFRNRLLASAAEIGQRPLLNIQNTFITYSCKTPDGFEVCHLEGSEPRGVCIDMTINYFKDHVDSKIKKNFKMELKDLNAYIKDYYTDYYSDIIDDPNSDFEQATELFQDVTNLLKGFLFDKKENDSYDEHGHYTYVDYISGDSVSRWDVLTEQFRTIVNSDGVTVVIENPYYNIYNPIYNNLNLIISNMKDDKFKSYDDIKKILDSITKLLYLYYDSSFEQKITEYDELSKTLKTELDGLEQLKNNYGISSLIHIKPIIILFNPTATWLDWDGNKIKIDEEGAYIAAPIFAAGKYEEKTGNFTGLTMGVQREEVDKKVQRIGLLGHYDGKQSLFIDAETGKAEFGLKEKGQIIIDPSTDSLKIYDSSYYQQNSTSGMCINFGERVTGTTISNPGYIHFKSGGGKIYSGDHNIYNSDAEGFYLSHDGLSIGDIMSILNCDKATVRSRLKEYKNYSIEESRRRGRNVKYHPERLPASRNKYFEMELQ